MHDFLCTANEAALTTYNIGRTQTETIKRRLKMIVVAEVHCTAPMAICVHNLGVILLLLHLSMPVHAKSSFAGTWEGKMNDLPGIGLNIDEADGKVSGTIVFYFQERSNANEPWYVAGESPVPLLAPRVDGRIPLTFEVQHHKCHTCPELGPNLKFRVELAGPNEALLWKLEERGTKERQRVGSWPEARAPN